MTCETKEPTQDALPYPGLQKVNGGGGLKKNKDLDPAASDSSETEKEHQQNHPDPPPVLGDTSQSHQRQKSLS